MLPNMRLSGANNSSADSMGDFLGVSLTQSAAAVGASTSLNRIAATSSITNHRVSGPIQAPSSSVNAMSNVSWGSNKTLTDYVKESAWHSNPLGVAAIIGANNTNSTSTSLPWAAAVKSPPDHHQQNHHHSILLSNSQTAGNSNQAAAGSYDYNNSTIGSWNPPESSSSSLNADGSSKNSGVFDDGTAVWAKNSKKTGVDWTERELLINPPQQTQANSNSEKRTQKTEPLISSINGTEAWGAPQQTSVRGSSSNINNSQLSVKNDIGGNNNNVNNNFGTKASNESLSWAESSSLQQQLQLQNENSSPPNNSSWNSLGVKQKSSDWLSSSSSTNTSSRTNELNKQLESASLFDSIASSMTNKSASSNNNPNLEHHHLHHSIGVGGNGMNDLTNKQMGANYQTSSDLFDSSNVVGSNTAATSSLSSINSNQQLESANYSSSSSSLGTAAGAALSRDLLKQMVHQIQLAVQAGHLNAHIFNQPMSTPTLQLVYQLLQQIKTLHQLQEVQQRAGLKSDMNSPSNLDLQINKTRQNITSLQKAIAQQQAALTTANTTNEAIGESNNAMKQANNYSYATISKLSTNTKVPSRSNNINTNNNNMSTIITNSNIDSFRRSGLINTFSNNSNSDSLRSAQATYDASATIDKTLSSLIQQASSSNNILLGNKTITNSVGDSFTTGEGTAKGFNNGNNNGNNGQHQVNGLLSAQQSTPSSAWSSFGSDDYISKQNNSSSSGWGSTTNQLRISSNVSQQNQHHFGASAFDIVPEFGGKVWRDSPDDKNSSSAAIVGPSGRQNAGLKQMSENRSDSLFQDWNSTSGNGSDDRNSFEQISGATNSFSPSAIGGLPLQSNPWMFASSSTTSALNNMRGGIDNSLQATTNSGNSGRDNGTSNTSSSSANNTEKMAGDSLFLKNTASNTQLPRSPPSDLYDWGGLGVGGGSSSALRFGSDPNHHNMVVVKQTPSASASIAGLSAAGGRPAPPPGLLSSFGPIMNNSSSVNGISMLDSKLTNDDELSAQQMQSRNSASSLWSGAWFD